MTYQAICATSFAKLGIRCTDDAVLGIDFLPVSARALLPAMRWHRRYVRNLNRIWLMLIFRFDLPLKLEGTPHQCKVWQAMRAIPCGQTQTYGELAAQIGSSARAVGQACGNNPVPIVVPAIEW